MTDKPILDIPIDDSAFTRFTEKFTKHQDAVKKLPEAWQAVTKGQEKTVAVLALMAQQNAIINKSVLGISAAIEKGVKAQGEMLKATRDSAYSMESLSRETGKIAGNIGSATANLLKWVGIGGAISGLLGVGSVWGLDRLALSEGAARRSALGLGLGSGQQQAFGLAYGRAVDANGFLSNVAGAQSDPRQAAGFYALGLRNYAQEDVASLGQDVLDRIRSQALATPLPMLGARAEAMQWTQFLGMEDIRRLRNTPDDEYARMRGNYGRYARQIAIDPAVQSAWQDFSAALGLAGRTIENKLAGPLVALEKPLEHVSDGFVKVATAFLQSDSLKRWLGEIGDGLDGFAKTVGTPEFAKEVESFVNGVGRIAKAVWGAMEWITTGMAPQDGAVGDDGLSGPGIAGLAHGGQNEWLKAHGAQATPAQATFGFDSVLAGGRRLFGGSVGLTGSQRFAHDYFRKQGWDEDQTAGILAYIQAESGFRTNAFNPAGGGQGAVGIGQWRGPRIERFKKIFGHDPRDAPLDEQITFFEWELEHTEKGAANALRQTHDPGAAADTVTKLFGRPGADFKPEYYRHREDLGIDLYTRAQQTPTITLRNQTGADVVTSAGGVGGP